MLSHDEMIKKEREILEKVGYSVVEIRTECYNVRHPDGHILEAQMSKIGVDYTFLSNKVIHPLTSIEDAFRLWFDYGFALTRLDLQVMGEFVTATVISPMLDEPINVTAPKKELATIVSLAWLITFDAHKVAA